MMRKSKLVDIDMLRPLVFSSIFFGLASTDELEIPSAQSTQLSPQKRKKCASAYRTVILIMLTISTAGTLWMSLRFELSNNGVLHYASVAVTVLFCYQAFACYYVHIRGDSDRTLSAIVSSFRRIDAILLQNEGMYEYTDEEPNFRRKVMIVYVLHFIVYVLNNMDYKLVQLVHGINCAVLHAVHTVNIIEFVGLLTLLKSRFSALNDLVDKFVDNLQIGYPQLNTRDKGIDKVWNMSSPKNQENNLLLIRRVHYELHLLAARVNGRFRLQLFGEVCTLFLVMVFCSYAMLNSSLFVSSAIPKTIVSMGSLLMTNVFRFVWVVYHCREVSEETSRTVVAVLRPLPSAADPPILPLIRQVTRFGSATFDAGGVLELKLQLLLGVLSSSATYLLVLQQYKDISKH